MESGCHLNVSPLLDENNHLAMYDCYNSAIIKWSDPEGDAENDRLNELFESEDSLESDGFHIQTTELWIYGPYSIREPVY
jgi:hypothetical protein